MNPPSVIRDSGWTAKLMIAFYIVSNLQLAPTSAAESGSWTPESMMQVQRVGSVQVSPNGRQATFAVRQAIMETETSEFRTHVHLVNTDGSNQRQLTRGDQSCDDPQWSPDGRWIAFITDRSKKKNLWILPVDGGEARQLTDVKGGVNSFRWSPDGRSIAFSSVDPKSEQQERSEREKNDAVVVDENVKHVRLYVVPFDSLSIAPQPAKVLSPEGRSVAVDTGRAGRPAFDWSPDSKRLVYAHVRTPQPDDWGTSDLAIVDVETASLTNLIDSPAAESTPLFSPDGQQIAFTRSDHPATWAGNRRVATVSARGGSVDELAETADGFGRYSEIIGWAQDGKKLYFTEVRGTGLQLLQLPLKGPPEFVGLGNGMSSGGVFLNATRTHFGFGWEQLGTAPQVYCAEVSLFAPRQIGWVQSGLPPLAELGRSAVIRWKSFDNTEIEGLLTRPKNFAEGVRYPLLLVIHGGPMGVFTQSFDGNPGTYPIATFADRGYLVLRPNPRGSSGYGKKFRYDNYGDWGGGDYRDIMAGVDWLIEQGLADSQRMGVMGWSYGGFMTSWTITQTKRFRAASVGAGVTNLVSFTGTADIPSFLPDYFGGEYWQRLEPYTTHSAMFHVSGVTTPTLIQHGEQDLRVPLSQGQELYSALKRQGCITKMVIYPRTLHGIEEPKLMLDSMHRNLDWFQQYVTLKSK